MDRGPVLEKTVILIVSESEKVENNWSRWFSFDQQWKY